MLGAGGHGPGHHPAEETWVILHPEQVAQRLPRHGEDGTTSSADEKAVSTGAPRPPRPQVHTQNAADACPPWAGSGSTVFLTFFLPPNFLFCSHRMQFLKNCGKTHDVRISLSAILSAQPRGIQYIRTERPSTTISTNSHLPRRKLPPQTPDTLAGVQRRARPSPWPAAAPPVNGRCRPSIRVGRGEAASLLQALPGGHCSARPLPALRSSGLKPSGSRNYR